MSFTTKKIASSVLLFVSLIFVSTGSIAAECVSANECYYTFSDNKTDALDTAVFYEVTGDDYTPGCTLANSAEDQGHYFLSELPAQIGLDTFQLEPNSVPTNMCYPVSTDPSKIAVVSNIYGYTTSSDTAELYVKVTITDLNGSAHEATYKKDAVMDCSSTSKTISWSYDSVTTAGAFKVTCV